MFQVYQQYGGQHPNVQNGKQTSMNAYKRIQSKILSGFGKQISQIQSNKSIEFFHVA